MNIYLLRHCQASGQAPEAPLTTNGCAQANALQRALYDIGIKKIISSPYTRAYESIAPFAGSQKLTIETDDRLSERRLAQSHLENWRDKLKNTFTDFELAYPGGESSQQAQARAKSVLTDLITTQISPALLVTHGNLLTLMLNAYNPSFDFTAWEKMHTPDLYHLKLHGEHSNHISQIELHL